MIDLQLPLIDLHRHLDGNIRLETIIDLGHKFNVPLPAWTEESLRPYIQITYPQPGVMAFIDKFRWSMAVLKDADACFRVAYENIEDAHLEGIDYIELRFSPWFMAESNHLNPSAVVESVVDGIHAGQHEFHVKVNLIGILSRTYGPLTAKRELLALREKSTHITALDLAGDEIIYPPELFQEHFQIARDLGWNITIHAGESAGPESVWNAVRALGAQRIGHGVRAIEDPALMDYLAENKIGIESCLTSNVQTSCVADYASHPIKEFLSRGILATINTDDPGISGIDLKHEFSVAESETGLTVEQIHQLQKNALEVAFIAESDRVLLREEKEIGLDNKAGYHS